MPNITVFNLHSGPMSIPGGYYVAAIPTAGSATFDVPDTNEFVYDSRIVDLVNGGHIRLEYSAADSLDRPLAVYTTATLPVAAEQAAGTIVWNSTERAVYESDGTNWTSAVSGSAAQLTADTTSIAANRFVGLTTAGLLVVSPTAAERWAGISTEAITLSTTGKVAMGGRAEVMPSAAIAANDELVCEVGGVAAPYQAADISLGTAVAGADASDDIDQINLPDQVSAICAGIETGSMIIYGTVGAAYTKETVSLVGGAGTYTSINTWAAVYCVEMTVAAVGNIDVQDASLVGNLFPQITALDAARMYGAIVPDVATDSQGHQVRVAAGGANASACVIWGTDYAGTEQAEVVTMNGTADVEGTLAYRSFDQMFIGADGIAWNAGATSEYEMDVELDEKNQIRAYAFEAEAVAGATVGCTLLPQNSGIVRGEFPAPYHSSVVSWGGGAANYDTEVLGIAATDVIIATMSAKANAVTLDMATYQAADTVRLTWSLDPGAGTKVSLLVFRP